MSDVETADGGLGVHGTILGEGDANGGEVYHFSQAENGFLIGQAGISYGWTYAGPMNLAVQVFTGSFHQAVAKGLEEQGIVVADSLLLLDGFKAVDECLTDGGSKESDVVATQRRDIVAETFADAFRKVLPRGGQCDYTVTARATSIMLCLSQGYLDMVVCPLGWIEGLHTTHIVGSICCKPLQPCICIGTELLSLFGIAFYFPCKVEHLPVDEWQEFADGD